MPDVVRKTDFEKRELVFLRWKQQDNLELSIKLDLIWKKKKTQAPGTTSTETIAMMMVSSGDGLKAIARKWKGELLSATIPQPYDVNRFIVLQ